MEVLIVPEGLEAGMAVEYRHPWVGRSREKSGKKIRETYTWIPMCRTSKTQSLYLKIAVALYSIS